MLMKSFIGCWGTPVDIVDQFPLPNITDSEQACAYVIASDLGGGAACKFDYCSMFFSKLKEIQT